MQKIIVLTTIIIMTLVLTGCGTGVVGSKPVETSPAATTQAGNEANQQPNSKDANLQPDSIDSTTKSTVNSTSSQTTGSTAIVAKSENIMSSKDKEELLNQIDKELDSLFSNINNLEDTQDADLDFN